MDRVALWRRVLEQPPDAPGHRRTYEAGPCHPQTHPAPAWATKRGCDLRLLHAAYTAHTLLAGRGEDTECAASDAVPGPDPAHPSPPGLDTRRRLDSGGIEDMARKKLDPELVVLDQFATLPLDRADLLLKFCAKIVADRKPAPVRQQAPRAPGRQRKVILTAAPPEA